jgi:hypothetical protein
MQAVPPAGDVRRLIQSLIISTTPDTSERRKHRELPAEPPYLRRAN